ncbi:hypothetical protein R80B4_02845 [Fibrobacteres bacterium R8-0-B4]
MRFLNQLGRTLLLTAALTAIISATLTGCGNNGDSGTNNTTPPDTAGSGTGSNSFGPPSNVTAAATSSNAILVRWSPVTDAVLYYVYKSNTANGSFTRLDTTSATSYTHTGLSANTTLYYKIYAFNGTDMSDESRTVSATTEANGNIVTSTFTDPRDGKIYKTVNMPDGKTWLGENLNFTPRPADPGAKNSWCYDNNPANCITYGRLYDWATAMRISSIYNSEEWGGSDEGHQGICPAGWHLPSRGEWETLIDSVGENAGTKLKAADGWWLSPSNPVIGSDEYGFSALPGGIRSNLDMVFINIENVGVWWSSSEFDGDGSYTISTNSNVQNTNIENSTKFNGFSVRCVRN